MVFILLEMRMYRDVQSARHDSNCQSLRLLVARGLLSAETDHLRLLLGVLSRNVELANDALCVLY